MNKYMLLLCLYTSVCSAAQRFVPIERQQCEFAVPAPKKARVAARQAEEKELDHIDKLLGEQMLVVAVKENNVRLAQGALKNGIDLRTADLKVFSDEQESFPNNVSWPLLHYACWNGTLGMVKLLVEEGNADKYAKYLISDHGNSTPLLCATVRAQGKQDPDAAAIVKYLTTRDSKDTVNK